MAKGDCMRTRSLRERSCNAISGKIICLIAQGFGRNRSCRAQAAEIDCVYAVHKVRPEMNVPTIG